MQHRIYIFIEYYGMLGCNEPSNILYIYICGMGIGQDSESDNIPQIGIYVVGK
jgi:hypothetical protein